MTQILGESIALRFSEHTGLGCIFLPEGLSPSLASTISLHLNILRKAEPPFSILVSAQSEKVYDTGCTVVSPLNALKYRLGDRLAVVDGSITNLMSFTQTFTEIMSADFPGGAGGAQGVTELATAAVESVIKNSGTAASMSDAGEQAANRLEECFKCLAEAYRAIKQGTKPWNIYWFEHVALGLEVLSGRLRRAVTSEQDLDLAEFFRRYTYAAFGLPQPVRGVKLSVVPKSGEKIAEAIESWWCNSKMILASTELLRDHPDSNGVTHPLGGLDWTAHGETLAAVDNALAAFAVHGSKSASFIDAFAELTERQFFRPDSRDWVNRELRILNETGLSLRLTDAGGPHMIGIHWDPVEGAAGSWLSRNVTVVLPMLKHNLSEDELDSRLSMSGLRLSATASNVRLEGTLESADVGVVFSGRFLLTRSTYPTKLEVFECGVELQLPDSDPLLGVLPERATAKVILVPEDRKRMVVFAKRGRGALHLLGEVEDFASIHDEDPVDPEYRVYLELEKPGQYAAYITQCEDARRDGQAINSWVEEASWLSEFKLADSVVFQLDEDLVEVHTESDEEVVISPLLAAAKGKEPFRGEVDPMIRDSLRGRLEEVMVTWLSTDEFVSSLGHIALEPGGVLSPDSLEPICRGAFLGSEELGRKWPAHFTLEIPVEFMVSDAVATFQDAFVGLDLDRHLRYSASDMQQPVWPSRSSWRRLWQGDPLRRYLEAFTSMVAAAQATGNASAIFWASYPFSVSVWSTDPNDPSSLARSVMLSPLHPIRLCWLAATEWCLDETFRASDADVASALGGTVEGWNLPLVGPSGSPFGRMIAVPSESGDSQLFAGWSVLAPVSVGSPTQVHVPQRVAGLTSPGSSSSGLNAASTRAALKDYRRVNPHVSTITVDLASAVPTTRMVDVDKAVLGALEAWSQTSRASTPFDTSEAATGGFRVLDSLNRSGHAPKDEIAALLQRREGTPLVWTRYAHQPEKTNRCNLRLLQDSGVRVTVVPQDGASAGHSGILGPAPLRRFDGVPPKFLDAHSAASQPAVSPEAGWGPFTRALEQVEAAASRPQVVTQLFNALLIDDRADWTVSGETYMSPAAMAHLLESASQSQQMLWEWRPPILERTAESDGGLLLERRPFVSVVRVPSAFKSRLRNSIEVVREREIDDGVVNGVLGVLGVRGVGLSSLVSMGGTHVAGALGFYLSLRLLDVLSESADDFFVMPIDACESFLRALGDPKFKRADRQKADLLAISLTDESVVMIPIEVKFYGLLAQAPGATLPGITSSALDKSVSQLNATMDLLRSVEGESRNVAAAPLSGRSLLWSNALGTFLEAAIRLRGKSAENSPNTARRLQAVVEGRIPLVIGRPVITYYGHGAQTQEGRDGTSIYGEASTGRSDIGEVGALIANPGRVWSEIEAGVGPLIDGWRSVMEWAAALAPSVVEDRRQTPEVKPASAVNEVPSPIGGFSDSAQDAAGETLRPDASSHADSGSPESEADEDPACTRGIRFEVGTYAQSVAAAPADFWPGNTALTQLNIGVVGDLGTGKTQLLKSLIHQLRRTAEDCQTNPVSVLIFDYKRDYQDETFQSAVGAEVISPFKIPLNIFALSGPYTGHAAFQKAQSFIDVLAKIYSGIGGVQRHNLGKAITDLFAESAGQPPTLRQVLERYETLVGSPDSVVSILSGFVIGEIFSDEPDSLVPFEDLIGDKVAVLALDKLGVDDRMKNSLVVLFLNFYYEHMLKLPKWPFSVVDDVTVRRLNSYLLVDEAVNIMQFQFPVLERLLLQGREFGLGVILGSQFLTHFKQGNTNYAEPLLTWFIHRVPAVTKNQLQALGLQGDLDELAARIPSLAVHHAVFRSLGCNGRLIRGLPFYEIVQRGT